MTDDAAPVGDVGATSLPVLEPREAVPPPVESRQRLRETAERLAAGTGPVAIDAERASGYRYAPRAYLVQLRRAGAGTFLVDPVPLGGLHLLGDAIGDAEWVLHAATQDLPCLAGEGMRPRTLFDTELAGRLLGLPRVGLAAMVEELLGWHLEKGFSAVDWSTRPLPEPWLRYAALDVELLLELRDVLEQRLRAAGKWEWARQEFDALTRFAPPPPADEPWRRTSGMHRVRRPRQLAVVRELWLARDAIARDRDTAPGRILPDAAIVDIALAAPRTTDELAALPVATARPVVRRRSRSWVEAVRRGLAVPDDQLPAQARGYDGPPPPRAWAERDPDAAARLAAARSELSRVADAHQLPVENVLQPDIVRRLCWDPPEPVDAAAVARFCTHQGARPWQVALTAELLARACAQSATGGASGRLSGNDA